MENFLFGEGVGPDFSLSLKVRVEHPFHRLHGVCAVKESALNPPDGVLAAFACLSNLVLLH